MKIVADQQIPYVEEYFGHVGELCLKPGRAITAYDVHDADILLVRSITRVDSGLLKNSRVRFVGSVTAGADHLDTHWMEQHGIAWSVAKGFNAPSVAEYVSSVISVLQQSTFKGDGKRAAVIGVGHVGKLVVEKLKQHGFEVVLCDPLRAEVEANFISTPLGEINNVDLICLHVPLTMVGSYPTYHMINQTFLSRQRPGCVLLNAARGAVIDSAELLQYGKHLTWCFDVWENEPNINKSVLEKAFIATPHIAGYSVQSKLRGTEMIYHAAKIQGGTMKSLQEIHPISNSRDLIAITTQMKSLLLASENVGVAFDELRAQVSMAVTAENTTCNALSALRSR